MPPTVATELLDGLVFPEGPRWHEGRLWFSDLWGGRVIATDLGGSAEEMARFHDERPSGLGFLPDGTPLVVLMNSRQVVRLVGGGTELHADLSSFSEVINDMVVGPDGRAYVGFGTSLSRGAVRFGGVALVEPDGRTSVVLNDVPRPNGLVLSPDLKTLIYASSDTGELMTTRVDDSGGLSHLELFASLGGRRPDGICLDAAGAIWVGMLADGFLRVQEGGKVMDAFATGGGRLDIACVLGGPDRKTLLCAASITTFDALRAGLGSTAVGSIFTAQVDVAGAGWP